MFSGIDEKDVVRLFAFFEDKDANGDAGGIKEVRRQADDGVDVTVFQEFGADAFLGAAAEENAVRQNDRHDAVVFEKMKTVQEKGKVGGGFRGESVVFETHVFAQRFSGFPAVAERRIGDDSAEFRHSGEVGFAQVIGDDLEDFRSVVACVGS